jgi:hypothetical protein
MYFRLIVFVCVCVLSTASSLAQATEIIIQALDGKSGKSLPHQRLLIFGGESAEAPRFHDTSFEAITDEEGLAKLSFDLAKTSWIQVWVDYRSLCQTKPNLNSFSVQNILATGASSPNNCKSLAQTTVPGRFVVYSRSSSIGEKIGR